MVVVTSETSVSTLMRRQPAPDVLAESVALAALESELFDRRTPPPVMARYVLIEKIGAGGLGVVFRAYDPDLDRKVALKLLRVQPQRDTPEVSGLLREARLMAQLSHPNVVTIHDVGTYYEHDLGLITERHRDLAIPTEGIFLVMELLERGSLRDVLKQRPPIAPQRLLSLLLAAGQGLAAAHTHGIVHRDFKPGNVLIGTDGAVRVADFGLARSMGQPELDDGERGGTPAYMAPEQLRGELADELSDQYSFALTCYLALYGEHPFGRTSDGAEPSRERLGTTPRRRGISRRIYRVLRRALEPDPADRYPSMDALLRALRSARVNRPRRYALLGAAALAVAAAVEIARPDDLAAVCAQAGAVVDEVWGDTQRDQLRSAFLATGEPFAEGSWRSVNRSLDAYTEQWKQAARWSCEDTHVRHIQSEARLDLRTECLERRRRELSSAIELMADADPVVLAHAVQVVHGLGWIKGCEDPQGMEAQRLPDDPAQREALHLVWDELGRARVLELSGRYAEAMALARRARDEAGVHDDAPLLAAADLRMGSIAARRGEFESSRRLLLKGIQRAEGARQDALAADGWIRLLWVAGVEMEDTTQGELWEGFARAALRRLGDDPLREAELVHNLGGLDYRHERYDEALEHYQRALVAQRELLGDQDFRVARTLNHIANVLLMAGEPRRSLSFSGRSLTIRETILGSHHPLVAASLNNMAVAYLDLGELSAAQQAIEGSLRITTSSGLPEEVVANRLRRRLAEEHRRAPDEDDPRGG